MRGGTLDWSWTWGWVDIQGINNIIVYTFIAKC